MITDRGWGVTEVFGENLSQFHFVHHARKALLCSVIFEAAGGQRE